MLRAVVDALLLESVDLRGLAHSNFLEGHPSRGFDDFC